MDGLTISNIHLLNSPFWVCAIAHLPQLRPDPTSVRIYFRLYIPFTATTCMCTTSISPLRAKANSVCYPGVSHATWRCVLPPACLMATPRAKHGRHRPGLVLECFDRRLLLLRGLGAFDMFAIKCAPTQALTPTTPCYRRRRDRRQVWLELGGHPVRSDLRLKARTITVPIL